MNNVKVKLLMKSGLQIPEYAHDGDAGLDIRSDEDIIIYPGETKVIHTGLVTELPEGYAWEVSPRSGIDSKTKLRVRLGTIDSGYRGEIKVTIDNISNTSDLVNDGYRKYQIPVKDLDDSELQVNRDFHGAYHIKKGDRVAQLKLKVVPHCEWVIVDRLSESDRRDGGFGSTGTN